MAVLANAAKLLATTNETIPMPTISFDTLTVIEKLTEAETQLATKDDLFKIERRIDALHAKADKLDSRIAGELSLLKWSLSLVAGGILALNLGAFFPVL